MIGDFRCFLVANYWLSNHLFFELLLQPIFANSQSCDRQNINRKTTSLRVGQSGNREADCASMTIIGRHMGSCKQE